MKRFLLCGALCALSALPASAQNRANNPNQNTGAVFQLPPSVENVVSIDAQNLLIYQSKINDQTVYTPSIVRHVYSGGIARLFGGTTVPTALFATPGNFGGQNGNGQTGVTGATGGNGFGGNGFGGNSNGLGGGGNFGGNGFGGGNFGGGGFNQGVFNGPTLTNRGAINARVRPR